MANEFTIKKDDTTTGFEVDRVSGKVTTYELDSTGQPTDSALRADGSGGSAWQDVTYDIVRIWAFGG